MDCRELGEVGVVRQAVVLVVFWSCARRRARLKTLQRPFLTKVWARARATLWPLFLSPSGAGFTGYAYP